MAHNKVYGICEDKCRVRVPTLDMAENIDYRVDSGRSTDIQLKEVVGDICGAVDEFVSLFTKIKNGNTLSDSDITTMQNMLGVIETSYNKINTDY